MPISLPSKLVDVTVTLTLMTGFGVSYKPESGNLNATKDDSDTGRSVASLCVTPSSPTLKKVSYVGLNVLTGTPISQTKFRGEPYDGPQPCP